MVIRPRDAAVQILAGNWDLARHEMGKLWQAAGGSRPRPNIRRLEAGNALLQHSYNNKYSPMRKGRR